jgi:hypothetical protein
VVFLRLKAYVSMSLPLSHFLSLHNPKPKPNPDPNPNLTLSLTLTLMPVSCLDEFRYCAFLLDAEVTAPALMSLASRSLSLSFRLLSYLPCHYLRHWFCHCRLSLSFVFCLFMSVFAFVVRFDLVLSSILLERGPLPVGEIGKVTLTQSPTLTLTVTFTNPTVLNFILTLTLTLTLTLILTLTLNLTQNLTLTPKPNPNPNLSVYKKRPPILPFLTL